MRRARLWGLPAFYKPSYIMRVFLFIGMLLLTPVLRAQSITVQPYLQHAEPNSITVSWETSTGDETIVEWGATDQLGQSTTGTAAAGNGTSRVHHVNLTGLQPEMRYYYRVKTGTATSAVTNFMTPPLRTTEKNFSFVVMSDMQQDPAYTSVFAEMCNQGVLNQLKNTGENDPAKRLAFVMLPGDLVDYGNDYAQWQNTFFNPCQALFKNVPIYPILGNHDANSPNYFRYFVLPENGTSGYTEHWWYKDYANVRLIGLDTNTGYLINAQLDWLQTTLNNACQDDKIDFVFAQFHHPFHSELWVEGNLDYSGKLIEKLDAFSASCNKPSVHFYGHTHGYSRGHSMNARHSMVNVATAGGNIDHWNEYTQADYPEHVVSLDEYGFVWVDVEAGDDPKFTLKRYGRGDENGHVDNVLRDQFQIRKNSQPPAKPVGVNPAAGLAVHPTCAVTFSAGTFSDPDGDVHQGTQWQISTDPNFSTVALEQWRQNQNWYKEVDLQASDDLTNELISNFESGKTYYWRVRYRDPSLVWSDWSTPISFTTKTAMLTNNLLVNGGAEEGTTGWTTVVGAFESLASGECGGHNAYAGNRLFAVGGICSDNAYGEGYQMVDVSAYAEAINAGNARASFGGYLRDWQGSDVPEFRLDFYSAQNAKIGSTPKYAGPTAEWTLVRGLAEIPANTTKIRFVMSGTRQAGSDNDSYFDEMFLKLDTASCSGTGAAIEDETPQPKTMQMAIYPNPIQSKAQVVITGFERPVTYRVYDLLGREVAHGVFEHTASTLDLHKLHNGVYFVQIADAPAQKIQVSHR